MINQVNQVLEKDVSVAHVLNLFVTNRSLKSNWLKDTLVARLEAIAIENGIDLN